jgi:hypothetical protein
VIRSFEERFMAKKEADKKTKKVPKKATSGETQDPERSMSSKSR